MNTNMECFETLKQAIHQAIRFKVSSIMRVKTGSIWTQYGHLASRALLCAAKANAGNLKLQQTEQMVALKMEFTQLVRMNVDKLGPLHAQDNV